MLDGARLGWVVTDDADIMLQYCSRRSPDTVATVEVVWL
jgi:hypothetical protein